MIPYIPVSIPVDGSFVPVAFMLAYQFALNRNKNFYLVTLVTASMITSIAWIWLQLGLLTLSKGMNILHIYFIEVSLAILAYWFTKLFIALSKKNAY